MGKDMEEFPMKPKSLLTFVYMYISFQKDRYVDNRGFFFLRAFKLRESNTFFFLNPTCFYRS